MNLPPKLKALIDQDYNNRFIIDEPFRQVKPILQANSLTFFPDYTDHGLEHIESVCASVEALISEEAWKVFSGADAVTLVFSILLHDLAMHVTEDQFIDLITDASKPIISDTDDEPWSVLWRRFLVEAKRYDGRRLKELFGDPEPIREPPLDPMEMTRKDRMLIGEFIRIYHARLAHEFAVYGLTGGTGQISFDSISFEMRDIAGAIARSHNYPLRQMVPFLNKRYDKRDFQRIHAVYLGALLRIADYLQMESGRAAREVLKVKKIRSPISSREFGVHHSVRDLRTTHDDPESIFVDAVPSDIRSFVRLKSLIDGLQAELDTTWATLGEVYGRVAPLNSLQLTIRRVRSSFDDIKSLSNQLNFIPIDAKFRTTDSDILKLLIVPLYGNNPEIGIRELMQNSLDAVRELKSLSGSVNHAKEHANPLNGPDISIDFVAKGNESHVVISDRGIGMNADIVENYFLKAGASYRQSSAWAKVFKDESGKSKVHRSGRFGVGVLAAFLVGEKIEVTTRRYDEEPDRGIFFKATLDEENIQLTHVNAPIGTTIKIYSSKETLKVLRGSAESPESSKTDFFTLKDPLVVRTAVSGSARVHLKQSFKMPSPSDSDLDEWTLINPPGFDAVMWKYQGRHNQFTCNGILINSYGDYSSDLMGFLRKPSIAVFDKDGMLPINLQRTSLISTDYPFGDELRRSISEKYIEYCIETVPSKAMGQAKDEMLWYWAPKYDGFSRTHSMDHYPLFCTIHGVAHVEPKVVNAASLKRALVVWHNVSDTTYPSIPVESDLGIFGVHTTDSMTALSAVFRYALEGNLSYARGAEFKFAALGVRVLLKKKRLKDYDLFNRLPKFLSSQVSIERETDGWAIFKVGTCFSSVDYLSRIAEEEFGPNGNANSLLIAEIFLDKKTQMTGRSSQISNEWLRIVGDKGIPYDCRV